jgi:hypothetical protein
MSRDHHLPLFVVTADTESTASSIAACWALFTELLPGKALIKSVTVLYSLRNICERHANKSLPKDDRVFASYWLTVGKLLFPRYTRCLSSFNSGTLT